MKTPDGKELEPAEYDGYIADHRKESVLRENLDDDMTVAEIAEHHNVSKVTIHRHLTRHDIPIPKHLRNPAKMHDRTRKLHDEAGTRWLINPLLHDGNGRVERMADGGHDLADAIAWLCRVYECPTCNKEYPSRKHQHDCIRRHSRVCANQLKNKSETVL